MRILSKVNITNDQKNLDVNELLYDNNTVKTHRVNWILKIFYFSISLTSNKLYWIEDQLTDISTPFYTSVSWCWWVEPSATWLDTIHPTAMYMKHNKRKYYMECQCLKKYLTI